MYAPRRVPPPPPWWALVRLALAIAATGCTGVIESPSGQTRAGSGSGAGGVVPGGMAGAACAVAPAPIQRLTKLEYNNVVRDLFGVQKDYTAGFSDDAQGPAGFTTEGIAQNLSLSQVTDYLNAAKAV